MFPSPPQKVGAFTRLSPMKQSNDWSFSTTITPVNAPIIARPVPVYLTQERALSAQENHPAFNVSCFDPSESEEKPSITKKVIKITKKAICKRKPDTLASYKNKCEAKHSADQSKLDAFNKKIAAGTITTKEK